MLRILTVDWAYSARLATFTASRASCCRTWCGHHGPRITFSSSGGVFWWVFIFTWHEAPGLAMTWLTSRLRQMQSRLPIAAKIAKIVKSCCVAHMHYCSREHEGHPAPEATDGCKCGDK